MEAYPGAGVRHVEMIAIGLGLVAARAVRRDLIAEGGDHTAKLALRIVRSRLPLARHRRELRALATSLQRYNGPSAALRRRLKRGLRAKRVAGGVTSKSRVKVCRTWRVVMFRGYHTTYAHVQPRIAGEGEAGAPCPR